MLARFYRNTVGAAAAEFALSLIILLPLLLWMVRFADLLNINHKAIEAARFAVWEKAHGKSTIEITAEIDHFVKSSSMLPRSSPVETELNIQTNSSIDVFKVLPVPGAIYPVSGVSDALGLGDNNYYTSQLQIKGRLFGGIDYTLQKNYGMIADPWQLVDQEIDGVKDGHITDVDLKETVDRIYFYVPVEIGGLRPGKILSSTVKRLLDIVNGIGNNDFADFLEGLTDLKFDIDPRGYPTLERVPKASN